MSSQGPPVPDHQARGVKRSVEEETMPPAKRIASDLNANLTNAFQDLSISSDQRTPKFEGGLPIRAMPTAERTGSALDSNLTKAFKDMSISTVQETPHFMGGLPIHTTPPAKRIPNALDSSLTTAFKDMSLKTVQRTPQPMGGFPAKRSCTALLEESLQDLSIEGLPIHTRMSPTPLSRDVPIYTTPEKTRSCHTRAKRPRIEDIEQASVPKSIKRPKQELPIRTAISSDAYDAIAHAISALNTKTSPQSLQQSPLPEPTQPKRASLMGLPSELRLKILSHGLNSTVGPSGMISVNPRADILSNPSGRQTKWRTRRGMLQTCHKLREEALAVLYSENTFFARMTQCSGTFFSFEKRRLRLWLESLGGDAEVSRIRKVTFAVEWPSVHDGNRWTRRIGDVSVCISRSGASVGGSQRIVECPAAPLRQLQSMLDKFMDGKAEGEGLGYDEWMAIWDKVQELMESGWGSPW